MVEQKSLVAKIIPVIDDEGISSFAEGFTKSIQDVLNTADVSISNVGGVVGGGPDDSNNPMVKKQEETVEGISEQIEEQSKLRSFISEIGGKLVEGGTIILGLFKGVGDIAEGLWKRILSISPILEDLMGGFNTVIKLVWMPFGIALAEVFVPILTEIMELAVGITDELMMAYEDGGIGALFTEGIANAVDFMFEAVIMALEAIPEGTLIGKIANFVGDVLTWIREHLPQIEGILNFLVDVGKWIFDHLKLILSVVTGYIAYKLTSDALGFLGLIPGVSAIAGGVVGGIVGGVTYNELSKKGFAEGGYIESSPGGSWINVAEGGEGEFVIPKSKVSSFTSNYGGSTVINNFYINGYTDSELVDKIEETINQSNNLSQLRGGL